MTGTSHLGAPSTGEESGGVLAQLRELRLSSTVRGVLIAGLVAAYGYETVAKFANLASPWMVLVFLAFGLVGLRQFIDATGVEINSAGRLAS